MVVVVVVAVVVVVIGVMFVADVVAAKRVVLVVIVVVVVGVAVLFVLLVGVEVVVGVAVSQWALYLHLHLLQFEGVLDPLSFASSSSVCCPALALPLPLLATHREPRRMGPHPLALQLFSCGSWVSLYGI